MFSRTFQRIYAICTITVWFAGLCASNAAQTAWLVQSIGGADHPALQTAIEINSNESQGNRTITIVVDPATFWNVVDSYEGDHKACCAVSGAAATLSNLPDFELPAISAAPIHLSARLTSRTTAPETPPPRRLL